MSRRGDGRRIDRGIWLSFGTVLASVTTSLVVEVTASKVSPFVDNRLLAVVLDPVVLWGVAGLALAAFIVLAVLRRIVPEPPPPHPPGLPAPTDLVGRDDAVRQIVSVVRRTGVVLVRGPAGIGASAAAIKAGWELAPESPHQSYVDLRGPDPDPRRTESTRRVAIRVLRHLGITPGPFQDPARAAAKIADSLRHSGRLLLLDNVRKIEQVRWALRSVPGAYVIAVGDFEGSDVPGAPYVHVGPLAAGDGLTLLCRQGDGRRPGNRFSRLLRFGRGAGTGASVADRVRAEPEAARELARRCLKHPRVVVQIGRWLAVNPGITVGRLLDDLRRVEDNSELQLILRRQLDGASAGARGLLSLLATAPVAELTEAVAAALAGAPVDRTAGQLKELAERSLIDQITLSRFRVSNEARQLAEPVGPKARDRSLVRLAAHLAEITDAHAEGMAPGRVDENAVTWFETEDINLLQLLRLARPPRRAAPHLWRISDGLEAWFTREHRGNDRRATAEAMVAAAQSVGDGPALAIGRLRLAAIAVAEGAFDDAQEHFDHADGERRRSDRWRPQYETARVVWDVVVTGDLKAAESHLDACRRTRPRRDVHGRLIDLINLAVLHTAQRRHDPAYDCLIQVLDLAENTDPGTYAHGRELMGVVAWRRGHAEQARTEWTAAAQLYERLGDDTGLARCLQHHGVSLTEGSARERGEAAAMLTRSLELRGDHGGLGPAMAHLALASLTNDASEVARHREAGLRALAPWTRQSPQPAEVLRLRDRLTAIEPNRTDS